MTRPGAAPRRLGVTPLDCAGVTASDGGRAVTPVTRSGAGASARAGAAPPPLTHDDDGVGAAAAAAATAEWRQSGSRRRAARRPVERGVRGTRVGVLGRQREPGAASDD